MSKRIARKLKTPSAEAPAIQPPQSSAAELPAVPVHPASVYQTHLLDPVAAARRGIRPIRKLLVANRS